jgi:hypothetical protein
VAERGDILDGETHMGQANSRVRFEKPSLIVGPSVALDIIHDV